MTRRRPGDWVEHAACAGMDPSLFFPERGDNVSSHKAREVCASCPVATDCRAYAKAAGERFGIWGGWSLLDRRRRAS